MPKKKLERGTCPHCKSKATKTLLNLVKSNFEGVSKMDESSEHKLVLPPPPEEGNPHPLFYLFWLVVYVFLTNPIVALGMILILKLFCEPTGVEFAKYRVALKKWKNSEYCFKCGKIWTWKLKST